MHPHPNEQTELHTQTLRRVIDAIAPQAIEWETIQHLTGGFQVAFDRWKLSNEEISAKAVPIGEALDKAGIPFSTNQSVLNVDLNEAGIETKLQQLIDDHKELGIANVVVTTPAPLPNQIQHAGTVAPLTSKDAQHTRP